MIHEVSASIVTAADGSATVYLGTRLRGRVHAIKYMPGTIDTGADLTITGETTAVPILVKANAGTANVFYYPRVIPNKNTDGTAFTDVAADIRVLNERIKVVVAQGGDTLTGTITAYVDTPEPY
jgi:hypothetical protein